MGYLAGAKRNCLETSNEIYINAVCKRGLHIMNYPINHKANSVSFTNFACDEYDCAYFELTFKWENGYTETRNVRTDSSSFSRFMLLVPELDNGEKATSLSYEIGGFPSKNCYDLADYDGTKHVSTEDDFYGEFRLDFYENPCQVCHPDRKPIDLELEEMEVALQESELRRSESEKSKSKESISEDSKSVISMSNNSNQVKSKPENEDSISNGSKSEESNAQNLYLQKIKLFFVSNNFCKLF